MRRKRTGFSLAELLIVILIIGLLSGLLFPVLARAKASAKQTACATNLKQASLALNLYIEDAGDYPMMLLDGKPIRATSPITAYSSSPTRIFLCPLDRSQGRGGLPQTDRKEPRSYGQTWFLWEGKDGVDAWKRLLGTEPNPIVFRCYFHDDRMRSLLQTHGWTTSFGSQNNALALAARKDGSIKLDRRNDLFLIPPGKKLADDKRSTWNQATEQPCPEDICDGLPPIGGIREY